MIAGALSSTEEKSLESGRAVGLDRNYGGWEAMLEVERVDFVSVVVPNHLHFEVAHVFVEAGFNVVLDKPMVNDSEQARHMARRGALGDIRKVIVDPGSATRAVPRACLSPLRSPRAKRTT